MENRGVLLYVDLGRLEDEPYRLSKIYDTLGQYIDDIRRQRDIIYISKMAESLDISSLDRYRAQLVDEYDRLGTLKKILDEAYDLYKECNEKFEASGQTLCNLYAETPWYETSEGKLAIGIGVLVVTAAVAIVCPAVLGAAAATVTQSIATSALVGSAISGIMNGAASVKAGKSFFDGFASGVEEGAIIGALCGMFGAGTAAMMTGAEMTVGNVFAARAINAVGDATIGTATYIYHENKYDKAITGGDVAKTWAECAITSFVLRSVFEGGKSSSKADGKNRGMSTSKGRVESESSITSESGSKTISQVDRIKIDAWDYTPDDELYLKYKDVFDNPKYYNQETGAINWPENNGFADIPMDEVLQPGARIDRYGSDYGSFTSPEGTPYEMRAVAPGTDQRPYSVFEVAESINVKSGSIASWFDEPGGGIQYLLPDTVDELLDAGILRRIQ